MQRLQPEVQILLCNYVAVLSGFFHETTAVDDALPHFGGGKNVHMNLWKLVETAFPSIQGKK